MHLRPGVGAHGALTAVSTRGAPPFGGQGRAGYVCFGGLQRCRAFVSVAGKGAWGGGLHASPRVACSFWGRAVGPAALGIQVVELDDRFFLVIAPVLTLRMAEFVSGVLRQATDRACPAARLFQGQGSRSGCPGNSGGRAGWQVLGSSTLCLRPAWLRSCRALYARLLIAIILLFVLLRL